MILRAALLLLLSASTAAAAEGASLTVRFGGLAADGPVAVALFDSEAGYRGDRPVATATVKVRNGQAVATFRSLSAGTYAVKSFQDNDGNSRLSTNALGIPQEPYAFSNNARGRFGPPGWKKAAFRLRAGSSVQSISLR